MIPWPKQNYKGTKMASSLLKIMKKDEREMVEGECQGS